MALSIGDCVKGTIVDWTMKYDPDERTDELRNPRRRGIIVKVTGSANDAITAVFVKFRADAEPVKVPPRELVRVYQWDHKVSRAALARLEGTNKVVGAEFEERAVRVRPRSEDALALTPSRRAAVVEPENVEIDPMLESQNEPLVVPDTDDEKAE